MKRKRILPAVLALCLLLAACARSPGVQPEPSVSGSAAEAGPSETGETLSELDNLAPQVNPGCRPDMPYPLTMSGESTATDFSRWTAKDLDGGEVSQDILKDSRITLMSVWTTFCGSHLEDLGILKELYDAYPRADVQIVGVVASAQKEDGTISEDEIGYVNYLLDLTGVEFLQLLPSDDLITIQLKDLTIVPEYILLDSGGKQIGDILRGPQTAETLHGLLDNALNETA